MWQTLLIIGLGKESCHEAGGNIPDPSVFVAFGITAMHQEECLCMKQMFSD